jgi:hypothetical protein
MHARHIGPQALVSSSATQLPLQSCLPEGQTPLHGVPTAMHLPAQRVVWLGQDVPQVIPLHVAEPPIGASHGRHDIPQVAVAMFDTQPSPGHGWKPDWQVGSICASPPGASGAPEEPSRPGVPPWPPWPAPP